ncbi:MAG: DNA-cytosine methyltransferase (EC [uncultured Caballeronia sp.]|nr:MAG: DNA-cytosine methyltransferase (EC [uncultured Caballeronia sp.]
MGARKGLALPTYPQPTGNTTVGETIGDIPDAETFPELWERDWTKRSTGKPATYAAYLRRKKDDPADFSYRRQFDASC